MLNVITVDDALKLIDDNFSLMTEYERVHITDAVDRVSAEDITGVDDVPSFSRSTMDGYALIAADTFGASESIPAVLDIAGEILMGEQADVGIVSGRCAVIPTGGMLPDGADAVIPVENTDNDCGECLIYKSVSPYENVTRKGDELKSGDMILGKGTVITPAHIGLLAAAGVRFVNAVKKPLVGIISTGNEIVDVNEQAVNGKVRDVNSSLLTGLFRSYGCETKFYGIIKDEYDCISDAVKLALSECDVVLISGGSSAGTKDMTVKVIDDIGTVIAHGLAMKPGKPTIIGKAFGKAVFGLPGHPGACFFVASVIVKHLIEVISGMTIYEKTVSKRLAENISSNHGREEYVCVKINGDSAVPVYGKSGLLSVMCISDGYIRIGRNTEGLKKDEEVTVYLF